MILPLTKRLFGKIKRNSFPSKQDRTYISWVKAKGDQTHRLDYELSDNSLVFDLGGYKGDWASDIFSRYLCKIFIFEPVKTYAEAITTRFKCNNKITVFNFGLGSVKEELEIGISKDASSTFKKTTQIETAQIESFENFFETMQLTKIDLLKINIEGGEYPLLEQLLKTTTIQKIQNIQVQFHNFVPNYKKRYELIYSGLKKTHSLTYHYPFIWENWKLKQDITDKPS